jgi:hypothetical protein
MCIGVQAVGAVQRSGIAGDGAARISFATFPSNPSAAARSSGAPGSKAISVDGFMCMTLQPGSFFASTKRTSSARTARS